MRVRCCRSLARAIALALGLLGAGSPGLGGAADATAPRDQGRLAERPLAGLPSPPGPHVARLAALPDDTWLDLGAPRPDPTWGRARGRSWTATMPHAPALGGAFLFGEGIHGWVDPRTGRYMDDLWFYDLMAHRWIAVYPGTDTRSPPDLVVNQDGFPALPTGDPVPIATSVHGYQMTEWDPRRRRFVSMPNPGVFWKAALPGIAAFAAAHQPRLNTGFASPWFYDVDRLAWLRYRTQTPSPQPWFGQTLHYIPNQDRFFLRHKREVWFYDPADNGWMRVTPSGPPPPFGIDATSCHDPKRDRIYIGGGSWPEAPGPNGLWIYDLAANAWIDPQPSGDAVGTVYGTNIAMMHCDLANDVVLLFRHGGNDRGIFVYDIAQNTWSRVLQGLPAPWPRGEFFKPANGFYDPALNVHVFHVAGDSDDDGRILVYRHRQAGADAPAR